MRYTAILKSLLGALVATLLFVGCSKEPDYPSVSFSALNISWDEDAGTGNVSLKIAGKANLTPVIVDVEFEPYTTGGNLDRIEFDKTTGYEVRPDSITKVYFTIKDDTELNTSQFKFKVKIVAASDAAIGSINVCNVTIVDNEKAPRINTGSYKMKYDVTGFTPLREGSGEFNLKLAKIDKYKYVAYNWFGMLRPRLTGVFDPEAKTLTFDGTDYDGAVYGSDDDTATYSAFGTAYYYYDVAMTQAMVFMGAGADGKSPIVFTTDQLQINETGDITGFASDITCSYKIFNFDKTLGEHGQTVGDAIGIYDMITNPTITYNDATKASVAWDEDGLTELEDASYRPAYPITMMPRAVKVR